MVSTMDSGLRGLDTSTGWRRSRAHRHTYPGLETEPSPGRGQCFVFLGKTVLEFSQYFFPAQVYKLFNAILNAVGNSSMDCDPIEKKKAGISSGIKHL